MNFKNLKYKANYYLLLLLAFVIPLERKLIAPITILFLVSSLFNAVYKFKERKKLLLFGIIFVQYLIGLFYTNNLDFGLKDIMTKLPLILVPIAFFISTINIKDKLINILKSFIDGCFVSTVIAIIYALIQYFFTNDAAAFFYGRIALFSHSSYLSMLLCMAIISIYYFSLSKKGIYKPLTTLFLLTLFSIYILLLASKTGLITMLISHLIFIGYWIIKEKKYLIGALIFFIIASGFLTIYKSSTVFKARIDELSSITKNDNTNTSTAARGTIWKSALHLIIQQPILGYGTGDGKDALIEEYIKNDYTYFAEKQLNAHNQFIQTSLSIGLSGGIILLAMILLPLYYAIKHKKIIYIGFLSLILINLLTESMLERQIGVAFYSLFNIVFFTAYFIPSIKKTT